MGNSFDINSVNYHHCLTNKILYRWYVPCTSSLRCHTLFGRYYSLATRQGPHSRSEHGNNEKNPYPCWESLPGSQHCNFARANWHVATRRRACFLML